MQVYSRYKHYYAELTVLAIFLAYLKTTPIDADSLRYDAFSRYEVV